MFLHLQQPNRYSKYIKTLFSTFPSSYSQLSVWYALEQNCNKFSHNIDICQLNELIEVPASTYVYMKNVELRNQLDCFVGEVGTGES